MKEKPTKAEDLAILHSDRIAEIYRDMLARQAENKEWRRTHYPKNPPNDRCRQALVERIGFQNTAGLSTGDWHRLLKFPHEDVFLWTHTKDEYSALVSEVDFGVHDLKVWKTFGSCLDLAGRLTRDFEEAPPIYYSWIYNFNKAKSITEQDFGGHERILLSRCLCVLRYLKEVAPVLELLSRDDTFYVSVQNLVCSFQNHEFCLTCALRKEGYQIHPNHEPSLCSAAGILPGMEAAIVQATRAVEGILGKPGKRDTRPKLERVRARWIDAVGFDPDERFENAGQSFLDYYYELFQIRGEAAHSLGKIPFTLTRKLTVEAQSFAWIIQDRYFRMKSVSQDEAITRLHLNVDLIGREPEDWITHRTADSKK